MNTADLVRLRHMLDAGREAIRFVEGRTLEDLRQLLLSLVKEIEIIGEAANQISRAGKATITGIPWPQVTAMRNRLTHGYFDWNPEIIWTTVISDLPDLVRALEQALSPLN